MKTTPRRWSSKETTPSTKRIARNAWAKPLPSRTVYGTKNWPNFGRFRKSGAFGLRFFLPIIPGTHRSIVGGAVRRFDLPSIAIFQLVHDSVLKSLFRCDKCLFFRFIYIQRTI